MARFPNVKSPTGNGKCSQYIFLVMQRFSTLRNHRISRIIRSRSPIYCTRPYYYSMDFFGCVCVGHLQIITFRQYNGSTLRRRKNNNFFYASSTFNELMNLLEIWLSNDALHIKFFSIVFEYLSRFRGFFRFIIKSMCWKKSAWSLIGKEIFFLMFQWIFIIHTDSCTCFAKYEWIKNHKQKHSNCIWLTWNSEGKWSASLSKHKHLNTLHLIQNWKWW